MIVYDNSIRQAIELKNKFHSNIKDIQTGVKAQHIIIERNTDWPSMYFVWLKPKNYWYSWFNLIITGDDMYVKIGTIEIHDNASVGIQVFQGNEVFDRVAQYLDKGNFRVTVVDKTLRSI